MRRASRRSIVLCLAVGGIIALWAGHRGLLTAAANWLDVGCPPRKADAVVLLNGDINTRPFVAAAVVNGGWTPRLLVSTVLSDELSEGEFPTCTEMNRRIFDHCSVPRQAVVVLDGRAATTFDEVRAVAAYLDAHPARRLLVVTEWPHTRRARWIFGVVLSGRAVEVEMVSAPTDDFRKDNWWRSELGFLFVASEYFKLAFYAFRYGWVGWECIVLVVAILLVLRWRRRGANPTHDGGAAGVLA